MFFERIDYDRIKDGFSSALRRSELEKRKTIEIKDRKVGICIIVLKTNFERVLKINTTDIGFINSESIPRNIDFEIKKKRVFYVARIIDELTHHYSSSTGGYLKSYTKRIIQTKEKNIKYLNKDEWRLCLDRHGNPNGLIEKIDSSDFEIVNDELIGKVIDIEKYNSVYSL